MLEKFYPKRGSSGALIYSPAGHREKLVKINKQWEEASMKKKGRYRSRLLAEKEIGTEFLKDLARPLSPEPPTDQWGSIGVVPVLSRKVPFITAELDAIEGARDAHRLIVQEGGAGSGPAREFWITSHHFPDETNLVVRHEAIWKILLTARVAENVIIDFTGTGLEAQGELKNRLLVMRDLPRHLIRHESPPAQQ